MASPTFDFDDQLSEDWISQPRSSDGTASPRQHHVRSNALQSRIPVPAGRKLLSSAAQSSNNPSPRPLHAKSKSELNIPILRALENKTNGRARRPPSTSRSASFNHRRSSSAQSWTADGTVQHLGSETRHAAANQGTPEWRRRLLKGQDSSEQKDLFSPMGLENVFRPPQPPKTSSAVQSPKRRSQTRPRAESSMIYPSSPPPYPSTQRRRGTTKSTSPSPFRERHEHDHNQCLAKGGKCEGALKMPTPTRRQSRVQPPKDGVRTSRAGSSASKRVQSSASVAENESISPVTFRNGCIDYQSVQNSVLRLQRKMQQMGLPEQERPSSRSSENGVDYGTTQRRQALMPEVLVTSLVDQPNLDSDAFAAQGEFVTTKRGGFSSDDNFHRRLLSPSSFHPDKSFLSENSASLAQSRPQTPRRDERFTQSSPEKPKSGGSPLKLFGHDTFTHNHIMRRLSQHVDPELAENSDPPSPSPARNTHRSSAVKPMADDYDFGIGAFDNYEFPPTESFLAEPSGEDDPSLPPVLPPTDSVMFSRPQVQSLNPRRRISRATAKRLSNPQSSQHSNRRPSLAEFRRSIGDTGDVKSDGKRWYNSPSKNHQSKRRRTLLSSIGSAEGSPEPPSYGLLIGKKRTDALPGETARNATPDILARREVLRPRSVSSPATRRNSTSTMSSWLGAESSRHPSEQVDTEVVDQPTKILADNLANFAVNVAARLMANGERKTSVTTADFVKEANMIMRHLRAQPPSSGSQTPNNRTPSGRASGDVSLVDQMSDIEELDEESIRSLRSLQARSSRSNHESASRLRDLKKADRNIRDPKTTKLNKYREYDYDLALAPSVTNLQIAPDHIPEYEGLPETDAPDIRILAQNPSEEEADGEVHTNIRTRSSTDVSVDRSIRTGGSSNSSRKFIAPESVKGQIGDCVGRMMLERERGCWVRNPDQSTGDRPGSSHLNSDGTEEDPLKSIPDLEDDDVSKRHYDSTANTPERSSSAGTVINKTHAASNEQQTESQGPSFHGASSGSRPSSGHGADSSQLSRLSKFGSSSAAPETRATSWSTVPPTKTQCVAVEPDLPQVEEVGETTDEQHIGDQPILETVESFEVPPGTANENAQRIPSISWSSPLSHIPDNVLFPTSSKKAAERASYLSTQQTPVRRTRVTTALLRSKEKAQQHLSVVKQRYSDRPVSRIDEQDEQATEDLFARHGPETSLILATPQPRQAVSTTSPAIVPPSSNQPFQRSFRLDPLSDFTMHHADESLHLDIDYVSKRHGLETRAEIDTRFQLAVRHLVAQITDIEPSEPYWETLTKIDLSNRKLVTLHLLDDFCEKLEELDVSGNELGQVNGAPTGLRTLDIRNNCLTSITAWGHLTNLHYLDVSGNNIEGLMDLSWLPHLRELRADGNRLTSLDGLKGSNGILKLSLKDNLISDADLSECDLMRLAELDLSGNQICTIPGLGQLSSLTSFRAAGNNIKLLSRNELPDSLGMLDLADNELVELDVSRLSHLKELDVDCNSLAKITGLKLIPCLETLSWRYQQLDPNTTIDFQDATDVRHLALSGNKIDMSGLRTQFLNLNTLEMASCGIESLPSRFGRLMPNLRFLDLNHNAIKDIRPLIGVKRLAHLRLVENRVHRLRDTASVLQKIGSELTAVDLRSNKITLGFYAAPPTPANTTRGRPRTVLLPAQNLLGANMPTLQDSLLRQASQEQNLSLDISHKARMDEGTALRRRVFELLVANGCPAIEEINGQVVDGEQLRVQDDAWQRLVQLKIVRPGSTEAEES